MRTTVLHRKQTRITAAITAAATTIYVQDSSDLPTVPFLAIINPASEAPEVILVTALNTTLTPNSMTVVRGAMGTTAVAWAADGLVYELGQKQILRGQIADISTAETCLMPMPKGFLVRLAGVLQGAITVGDATITVKKNTTSLGTITVANGSSAAGDWDELVSDGAAIADFFFDGVSDFLHIETNGGSTDAQKWEYIAEFIPY